MTEPAGRSRRLLEMPAFLGILAMALAAAPPPPLALDCRIEGAAMLRPAMAEFLICERIRNGLERRLKRQVVVGKDRLVGKANGIRVEVKFRPPGVAAAHLTFSGNFKSLKSPELSVSVMDRPLDATAVDMLAETIADYVAAN